MSVLFYLVPLAVLLGVFFLCAFIWATRQGQWDDLETPAYKILLEEKKE